MKLRVPVLMAMGFCCTAYAADYLGGFEGPYGQGRLDVTNDMTLSEVALTGMVYKTGSAELTLENPRSPAGGLSVNRASALVSVVDAVSSLGDLAAAGGTEVGVDVATGGNLAVGGIHTGVPLVKTGAGMLSVSGGVVVPALDVRSGGIRFVDCEHDAVPLTMNGLARFVTVEDGTISVAMAADPNTLVKAGSGTLSLSTLPEDVSNVVVNAGALRLYPAVVNGQDLVDVAIPDASFEHPSPSFTGYSTAAVPAGWTKAGKLEGHSSGKMGMDEAGSNWCLTERGQSVPDGQLEVFLQDDSSLSTKVKIPVRGRYRLSFWAHARYGNENGLMRVSIGGVTIADVKVVQLAPRYYAYETPVLEPGDNVDLSFVGRYYANTANRSVVFDDVKMSLIEARPDDSNRISVANPGFEWSDPMTNEGGSATNVVIAPSGAGWTFSGRGGIVEQWQAGMSGTMDYLFTGDAPPDGRRMAFLGAGGELSQTLTLPVAGRYRISFWMARPTRQSSPVPVTVKIDGEQTLDGRSLSPLGTDFREFVCRVDLPAGQHVLSLSAGADPGGDVLLDRVEVSVDQVGGFAEFEEAYEAIEQWSAEHPGDAGWIRVSPGADATYAGWTFGGPSDRAMSVCGPNNSKFVTMRYNGRVSAMLQDVSYVYRTGITLKRAGVYELSFMTAGRSGKLGKKYEVLWNGVRLGVVTTTTSTWKRMSFRVFATTAGEVGTLMFRGVGSVPDLSAFIDAVDVRWLSDFRIVDKPVVPSCANFDMAAETGLDLMFDGEVEVGSVRRNGRRVIGVNHVISAETCPGWVHGPGKFKIAPTGMIILFR